MRPKHANISWNKNSQKDYNSLNIWHALFNVINYFPKESKIYKIWAYEKYQMVILLKIFTNAENFTYTQMEAIFH